MIGLTTQFFGSFLDLPPHPGYFYLCPRCYDELVAPHSEEITRMLRAHSHLPDERGEHGREEGDETEA